MRRGRPHPRNHPRPRLEAHTRPPPDLRPPPVDRLPPVRLRTTMTRPLTAAQRRIVDAADPGTGRLRGT
ncbi:hypothetical protein ACWDOZ_09615, partial [Streptomyces fungicidicus]